MANVRKQLSVCDKLSSSPSMGFELIYFLPEYAYDLSLERIKRKIFSHQIAGYPIGNPTEIIFNDVGGPLPGMTYIQEA